MATEFVRAEFDDGAVASVSAAYAERHKLKVVADSLHVKALPADYSNVKQQKAAAEKKGS